MHAQVTITWPLLALTVTIRPIQYYTVVLQVSTESIFKIHSSYNNYYMIELTNVPKRPYLYLTPPGDIYTQSIFAYAAQEKKHHLKYELRSHVAPGAEAWSSSRRPTDHCKVAPTQVKLFLESFPITATIADILWLLLICEGTINVKTFDREAGKTPLLRLLRSWLPSTLNLNTLAQVNCYFIVGCWVKFPKLSPKLIFCFCHSFQW